MVKSKLLCRVLCIAILSLLVNMHSALAAIIYQKVDKAEIQAEYIDSLPGGWISEIGEEYTIINDTSYLITDETNFNSGPSKYVVGVFVKYDVSHENYLSQLYLAEPEEEDMDMKPRIFTSSEEKVPATNSNANDNSGNRNNNNSGTLRLENGVWVN